MINNTGVTTFHGEDYTKLTKNLSFRAEKEATPAEGKLDRNVFDETIEVIRAEYKKNDDGISVKPDLLASNYIIPDPVFTASQNAFTYPVFSLPHCQLKHPIEVIIEAKEDGNVIVWSDDFELSGLGGTKEEALADLSALAVSDYNSFKKIPIERLSEGAKDLLRIYEEYLE
ncbi:MAG: hypothetical protein KKD29_00180 [Candidatus Omnitrophica bacterium]|nr:hypothetical protein [Candidatus Omnitrophota bacterium]